MTSSDNTRDVPITSDPHPDQDPADHRWSHPWMFHSLFHPLMHLHGPMYHPLTPHSAFPYGPAGGLGHLHHPFPPFGGVGNRPPPPPPPPPASPLSPPPPPTPGPAWGRGASDHQSCPYIHGWWQNAQQQCPYVQRQVSGRDERAASDDKEFKVTINVSQFTPEDLNVTVVDGHIQIVGKHEERKDDHGYITREFTRRYLLPADVEASTVKSSLTQDGVLTVSAPRKQLEIAGEVHEVPISIEPPKIDDDKKES